MLFTFMGLVFSSRHIYLHVGSSFNSSMNLDTWTHETGSRCEHIRPGPVHDNSQIKKKRERQLPDQNRLPHGVTHIWSNPQHLYSNWAWSNRLKYKSRCSPADLQTKANFILHHTMCGEVYQRWACVTYSLPAAFCSCNLRCYTKATSRLWQIYKEDVCDTRN